MHGACSDDLGGAGEAPSKRLTEASHFDNRKAPSPGPTASRRVLRRFFGNRFPKLQKCQDIRAGQLKGTIMTARDSFSVS